ncbi:hypothetical protein ILUMI_25566 [Ignelater luminosus]|uniref:Uncharacterized protein n=1 Tax=Ignelater luminosus TaxID=2038154 RepID=A0A8K0FXT9_IGNLU|nr:hypothetical protein ILUMI_25566 [Ignelater luminosus]
MASRIHKFPRREIGRFSDRIQNVLDNKDAREILGEYLKEVKRRDLQNVLKLWKEAAKYLKDEGPYSEEEMWDQIDGIDDFNINPLMTISEKNDKLIYIQQESARILNRVLSVFIKYLEQKHMQ